MTQQIWCLQTVWSSSSSWISDMLLPLLRQLYGHDLLLSFVRRPSLCDGLASVFVLLLACLGCVFVSVSKPRPVFQTNEPAPVCLRRWSSLYDLSVDEKCTAQELVSDHLFTLMFNLSLVSCFILSFICRLLCWSGEQKKKLPCDQMKLNYMHRPFSWWGTWIKCLSQ